MEPNLINDHKVAKMLSISPEWVRNQRWRRRRGLEHVLTVEPVMIGRSPRYRIEDVETWIAELEVTND
jgi:hypothetical protein